MKEELMATITAAPGTQVKVVTPGFGSTLSSEFTKLRSVRSTYVEIFLTLALSLGMTALVCLAIGATFDEAGAQVQADFDPILTSFIGMAFGVVVMTVLGVTFLSSEYTSGMIRLTFTTTPKRGRVLAAKALVVTAVTLALGLVTSFASFFIGQAVLGAYDAPSASLSDPDARRAVVAAWLTSPFWPLIGLAIAGILRSTASAITTVMSIIFVPSFFGALLPDVVQEYVLKYLPGNAGDSLLMSGDTDSLTYMEPAMAVIVLLLWLAGFFGVAYLLLMRRDV
jgi:ABC-type transport system involved in multi-copper enzyme maturation permease subunit